MITKIIILTGLGVNSYFDLRKRLVSMLVVALLILLGIVIKIYDGCLFSPDTLYALLPGICCLGISRFTGESIGFGDSYMILALGFLMDAMSLIELGFWALFLTGICALFLIVIRKKGRKYEIPFIPFLLTGYVILLLTEG